MEKYNIRGLIGKGEFSEVFKGREKQSIEFLAIKRIEKSQMDVVVAEVQILHKLKNPHILRFKDWYETRNNLWLILEYCTGGDLEKLLEDDKFLPESSIHTFGQDILAGLKHLHTNGIIHCDLQPKNFLIDEFGMLKIADFKFAQKIPQSNNLPSTLLLESTTGAKDTGVSSKGSGNNTIGVEDVLKYRKGNSLYFAPELFTVDGVHSFHSDQWAVGCILYMMQVGSHPFEVINSSTSASMTLESLATRVSSYDPFVPDRLYPTQLETHVIDNLNHNPNPNPNLLSKSNQYSSRSYASPQATSRGTDPRRRIGSHDTPLSLPSNATESTNIPPKNREKISAQLCDLLRGLLTKCALYRPSWNAVETHPFWTRPESTPVPPSALPIVTIMPEQPAYELFLKQLEIETRAEKVNKMQTEFPVTSEVREYMLKVQDIPMDQIAYTLGTSLSIESSLRTMSLRAVPSESSGINVMDTAVVVGGMIRHTTSTSSLSSRGQQISESSQHSQSQKQDREVAGIHSTPVNKQSSNVTVHYTDTPTSGNAVLIGTPDTKRDSTVSEIDSPRIIIPSINRTGFKASGAANVIRNLQSDPSPIMTTPVKILPSATTINKDTYISPDSKSERGTSSAPARPNIQVTPFRVVPGPRSAITPGTGTTKASDTAGTPLAVTSTTTVATSKVTPTTPDRDFGVQLVPVSVTASATATDSSSHSNSHSQAASTSNSPDKFRGTYQQVATHPTNTAIITTTTTAPTTAPFATATATTATTTTNSFTGDNNKYDTLLTNEALESELFKAPEELQPTSLLFHSSDNLIQPIVGNSSIEIIDKQTIQAAQLVNSFAVLAADRMKQMTVEQIDVHLGTVYKALLKCTTTTTSSISPVQSKAGLQSNTSSSNSSNNSIAYQTSLLIERTNILLYLLSISSVEEVASRLMQPPHVGLILRSVCQKSSSQPVSSVGMRGGETAAISLHTQGATTTAVSSWNACRVLATDVLANCIRYSKEISPLTFTPRSVATPSTVTLASASTQGGLLYILVSILQTEINMDAILKRRMVAAVGELLFYISTQQEPLEENVVPSTSIASARPTSRTQVASSNSSSSSSGAYSQLSMRRNRSENSLNKAPKGTMSSATNINTNKVVDPNKWQMPCSLTEFLRSLLQPSGDEVLTHYVAKTIENIMAQGEDAFKKRLVLDNTDIIPTLLSISLLSTNEHLQSCCASSVSLALRYSLHQSNSSSGHNVGNNIGGNIAGTANTSAKSTHSKFMVKVMRDVDMDLCTTVFRESTSKLKQAYLNIINLVLMQTSNTKTSNAKRRDVDTEKTLVALPDSIQSLVSKFVHHSSLHRSILKLLDQTSSTIIRGKALLCIQLLCRNKPELLLNFVDSRLPIILHKTVETVMSWSNDPPIRSTSHTGPVSQPVKSALSLLYFLKTSAKVSAMLVMKSLDFLIKNNGNVDGRSASDSGLINASKVCSAVVAIVSIHPLLKKLVFCSSESSSFIQSVNTSLRIINTSSLSWVPSTVMLYVSQSLYESFELISFLPDMAQPESWPLSIKRNVDQSSLSPVAILLSSAGLLSTNQTYITHVHSLLLHHLPTLALLLYNRDGNIRVLAVTSARKLIPELISTFRNLRCRSDFILHNDFDVYLNDPTCILSILLPSIPALLMDQAPIPQYTIKLLLDTLTVADSAIGSVINKLYESNVLSSLVNLLNPTVRTQVPTQLRGSTSGSALETGLISASASRESLHSLGSQKSNDCQLSLSLSTDSNLLSLVHLIFEYLSTSLDDDNEHSRHLANKMIEYKIVKYLSRSLMALLSTQLSDHLRMTGISSDMTTDHHYSSSDAASTITSISAAHPVVELLYTVLVYGYGIVEDTRNALSSCTQSTEFSMIKSRLQNQLGMFDACADCFIPMFQLLFIIIRLNIESSISGDEYTLSTDFDMKGSFVATISSLDLIFQLFPDKGTYALLNTVSDSSEQYDQISRDISVAYQFKYMLGIKVIELINPVVTVKLLTLLSHITKIATTLQVMNEFKQFILSPQYLGPVWPGLRSWSEDRQMESVMALISLLVDHANQL